MPEPLRERREDYPHFLAIAARWMDNDLCGRVNNVVYYSFFDTVVNRYLINAGGLDIHASPVIGLAVETSAAFIATRRPAPVPATIRAALALLLTPHTGG